MLADLLTLYLKVEGIDSLIEVGFLFKGTIEMTVYENEEVHGIMVVLLIL